MQLFADFWDDSEILGQDYRGRELAKQLTRSLDSICANMKEGYGRGFTKELPYHLKISRGEARESKGRYTRCKRLLSPDLMQNVKLRWIKLSAVSLLQSTRLKGKIKRASRDLSPSPVTPTHHHAHCHSIRECVMMRRHHFPHALNA